MVRGVAIATIIVQGLLMAVVLRVTGVASPSGATGPPEEAEGGAGTGSSDSSASGRMPQGSDTSGDASGGSSEER